MSSFATSEDVAVKRRRIYIRVGWILATLFVAVLSNYGSPNSDVALSPTPGKLVARVADFESEPIAPLELPKNLDLSKVALGKDLFHDVRFSADNTISCSSCHSTALDGADGLKTAKGINGAVGSLNTPTVFNSGFYVGLFWDGRAETLESQVAGPIHGPGEMGSNWKEVIGKLKQDQQLVNRFHTIYERGMTIATISDAIASYEKALVTINSPFDRYLRGDKAALSKEAKEGYEFFKSLGCIACHQGRTVGGNMFQKMGVMDDYFLSDAKQDKANLGRFNVTGRPLDRHRFKVPSLREVASTSPYFHNGEVRSLRSAIEIMARHQLGKQLSHEQLTSIEAFLRSLSGEISEDLK